MSHDFVHNGYTLWHQIEETRQVEVIDRRHIQSGIITHPTNVQMTFHDYKKQYLMIATMVEY